MIRYKTLKVRLIEISANESDLGLLSSWANYHNTDRIGRQILDCGFPEILRCQSLDAGGIVECGSDVSYHRLIVTVQTCSIARSFVSEHKPICYLGADAGNFGICHQFGLESADVSDDR